MKSTTVQVRKISQRPPMLIVDSDADAGCYRSLNSHFVPGNKYGDKQHREAPWVRRGESGVYSNVI